MVILGMGLPEITDARIVLLPELADQAHFDIRHAGIVIPGFRKLFHQVYHPILEIGVEISACRGRIIILGTDFPWKVRRPMPTVQIVRIVGIRVFFIPAGVFLHPDDERTGDHLHIDILHSLPTVIRIRNHLVHAIVPGIFHHVPLHVFLNHGAEGIGINIPFAVIAGTEKLPPSLHRVAEGVIILERLHRDDSVLDGCRLRNRGNLAILRLPAGKWQGKEEHPCDAPRQINQPTHINSQDSGLPPSSRHWHQWHSEVSDTN